MTGLRVFELYAVGVIGLSGNYGQAVVIAQSQKGFIFPGGPLYSHTPLAGDDGHAQNIIDVFVNGSGGNGFGEAGNKILAEQVNIHD